MRYLLLPIQWLWRFWIILVFVIVFLIGYPWIKHYLHNESTYKKSFRVQRIIARVTAFLSGIVIRVKQVQPLNTHRTYVIISNHTSYLDVILSYAFLPLYYHFMGKNELERIPLFNVLFKKTNIPVDRKNRRSAHAAYQRACTDLQKGISIFLFPEATIPDHIPRLRHFKTGAARLAIENQVPILPITYLDHWRILPEGRNAWKGGRPGRNRIIIHPPISTSGLNESDVPALNQQLHKLTNDTLVQYNCLPPSGKTP
ncbi:MAG: 1-acyl-sn-glycerol-3-phosphate acyltransferase [Flavobacteriales bacterium]|nr:1-acyl-sn-glycerol-3-phosphate acyltransferase [Flavobacteriales bacterium]